jgi:hypothetical protein
MITTDLPQNSAHTEFRGKSVAIMVDDIPARSKHG